MFCEFWELRRTKEEGEGEGDGHGLGYGFCGKGVVVRSLGGADSGVWFW